MKKIIAILIAVMLIFSLASIAACSGNSTNTETETETAETETVESAAETEEAEETFGGYTYDELEASLPYEHLQEKVEAGMEVSCQYSAYVDNEMMMVMFADAVEETCSEYGISFNKIHAGADTTNQISQIENIITLGTNILFIAPADGSLIKEVAEEAQEQGIAVIVYGCSDASYAVSTFADQWTKGYMIGEMMYKYYTDVKEENGNVEKVALLGTRNIPPMQQQWDGIVDSLNAHDEFELAYQFDGVEDEITSGFDACENALTSDPDIRYIICQSQVPVVGVCNYIASIPGVNLDEYHVFTSNEDDSTKDLEELTLEGESCLRGTITADRTDAEYIKEVTENVIKGEYWKETVVMFKLAAIPVGWELDYTEADVDESLNPYLA